MDEGEDAGGAIMKKLYRIHSRHVLEINDSLKIDVSGHLIELKNKYSLAKPLDDV